jgi:hypothetical protein
MRTIVYVAGLNLYYGCLKGTPFQWLDPEAILLVRGVTPPLPYPER